uniref:Uncharacterized protein n=1 Tax=Oryza glumipatula TaxID=40148 RepID=A0A0D9Y4Z6_9ORYZ
MELTMARSGRRRRRRGGGGSGGDGGFSVARAAAGKELCRSRGGNPKIVVLGVCMVTITILPRWNGTERADRKKASFWN